jgi:hypothetical protein
MQWKTAVTWIFCAALLASCQSETTTFSGPSINAGPVTVSAHINNFGEIELSGEFSKKLVGVDGFDFGVNWDVGFSTTLNKASTRQNTLFILYKDEGGQIIQNEYAIDEPFVINFSDEQWVRKINNDSNGNIIVAVEYKVAESVVVQAQEPVNNIVPVNDPDQNNAIPTNPPLCTNVNVTVTDTNKGDIIHLECANWSYDTPYLAKGVYDIDPYNKFFVYCSNSGDVYMMKIGDSSLSLIQNIQDQMSAFQTGYVSLELSFIEDGNHHHTVKVIDRNSGQDATVKVPVTFSR